MNSNPQKNYNGEGLSSVDAELSFSQKDQQPESITIHTMKNDLKNAGNLQYPSISIKNDSSESAKPPLSSIASDAQQRTSPFLSKNIKREEKIAPVAPPDNNTSEKIVASPTPHTPSSWGKLVLITCVIFLLFAAGAGGYYFWMNKKSATKVPENAVVVPPKSTLALDKPNYLNISADVNQKDLTSAVDKYIKEVEDEKPNTPVEFMVVDDQNNPIAFKDFILKYGISLPADIADKLKDSFSLFIYLEENQPHIGLAIDSNDLIGTDLKEALAKNEPDMIKVVEPIYLSNLPIASSADPFNTSYYGGAEIRFKNIESTNGLSLDYTIFRDKLTIGTSKMTLRSVIDYLTSNGKVKGVEDVIENIPEEDL